MVTDDGKSCMKCGKTLSPQEVKEVEKHRKDYADRPGLIGPTKCNPCTVQFIWDEDAKIIRILKMREEKEKELKNGSVKK